MLMTIQVLYPVTGSTNFNYDYYFGKHMPIVEEAFGEHIQNTLITKGIAGVSDTQAGYYVIATLMFENQPALDLALSKMGPALADITNFTNSRASL